MTRAESQSGLTHKKYISTYQLGNTLLMCATDDLFWKISPPSPPPPPSWTRTQSTATRLPSSTLWPGRTTACPTMPRPSWRSIAGYARTTSPAAGPCSSTAGQHTGTPVLLVTACVCMCAVHMPLSHSMVAGERACVVFSVCV